MDKHDESPRLHFAKARVTNCCKMMALQLSSCPFVIKSTVEQASLGLQDMKSALSLRGKNQSGEASQICVCEQLCYTNALTIAEIVPQARSHH